jgi:hypothetical protein
MCRFLRNSIVHMHWFHMGQSQIWFGRRGWKRGGMGFKVLD